MPGMLRFVKELIKENRMITLTLEGKEYQLDIEQAKKLNLLKEKDNRVKSWDEFIKKYDNNVHAYSYNNIVGMIMHTPHASYTTEQLTSHEAKALAAFSKLLKLRRDWIGEWEYDWSIKDQVRGIIVVNHNRLTASASCAVSHPLTFPTKQMAQEFLETFFDLIEEAKILI